jgi:hypothetical protein
MPFTVDPAVPLLRQAEVCLAQAKAQEGQARLHWDGDRANVGLQQALSAARREHQAAQTWLDQLQRSRDTLPIALEEARRDFVRAESEYAQVMETARMTIARAQQRVRQAQAQVARIEQDGLAIMGPEAGPVA